MKRTHVYLLLSSAGLMLLLPWAVVAFVPGNAGMAACFVLFFAVNPLFSAVIGWFAAAYKSFALLLPAANAALFLLGAWLVFDMGETAFLSYGGIYLLIGLIAAGIRVLLPHYSQK